MEWLRLRRLSHELAAQVRCVDKSDAFRTLVGSEELRHEPVHRWFSYKEGFSPNLLARVIDELDLSSALKIVDPFGGVATCALSGLAHPSVAEVRSVEYSPFARFAGQVKLGYRDLDAGSLIELLPKALCYEHQAAVTVPPLAAFTDRRIFTSKRIRALLAARDHIATLAGATESERAFFLLGLAAVTEDLSGAMKDGRALRVKDRRRRRPSSLAATEPLVDMRGVVRRALAGQWSAMIEDLAPVSHGPGGQGRGVAMHLAGDARNLSKSRLPNGATAFPDAWADLSLFSPPYLNLIDYTELYKLELWLMGHIVDQSGFRDMRLGTLRSHPSVRFAETDRFGGLDAPVLDFARGASEWLTQHGARKEVGPVVRQYFEDMFDVWVEQRRVLKEGGVAVCVVANSTFSRRERRSNGEHREIWRMPLLTDVVLAHLAQLAGFQKVQLWHARDLRPRNVRAGRAREALVVAHV